MSPVTPDPRRWWALALLCAAFFMVILDANIVIVALPSIEADLGFSEQGLQWVISAYALTFAGLLLLGGRAADLLGRRRLFMVGLVLFTLASLVCGLAWSPGALIGARAFQGWRWRSCSWAGRGRHRTSRWSPWRRPEPGTEESGRVRRQVNQRGCASRTAAVAARTRSSAAARAATTVASSCHGSAIPALSPASPSRTPRRQNGL